MSNYKALLMSSQNGIQNPRLRQQLRQQNGSNQPLATTTIPPDDKETTPLMSSKCSKRRSFSSDLLQEALAAKSDLGLMPSEALLSLRSYRSQSLKKSPTRSGQRLSLNSSNLGPSHLSHNMQVGGGSELHGRDETLNFSGLFDMNSPSDLYNKEDSLQSGADSNGRSFTSVVPQLQLVTVEDEEEFLYGEEIPMSESSGGGSFRNKTDVPCNGGAESVSDDEDVMIIGLPVPGSDKEPFKDLSGVCHASEVGKEDGQSEESQYPLITLDSDEENSLVTMTENCSTSEIIRNEMDRPLVQHEKKITSEPEAAISTPINHQEVVKDIRYPIEEQQQVPNMNIEDFPRHHPSPDSLKRSPFSVDSKHNRNESDKPLIQARAPNKQAHDMISRHPSPHNLRRSSLCSVGCGSGPETTVHKSVGHQKSNKVSHSNYFLDRTEQMLPDKHFMDYPSLLQLEMDSPRPSSTFHFRYRSPSPGSENRGRSRSPGHRNVHKSRPRRPVEWNREKGTRPRLGSRSPTHQCKDRPRRRKISEGKNSSRGQSSPEGSPRLPGRRVPIPTSQNWVKFPKPIPPCVQAIHSAEPGSSRRPSGPHSDLESDFDEEIVVQKLNSTLQQICQSNLLNELVASMRVEEEERRVEEKKRRVEEERERAEKKKVLKMLAYKVQLSYKANIESLASAECPQAKTIVQPPSYSPVVTYPQQMNSPAPRAVVLPLRRAAFSQPNPYEIQSYRVPYPPRLLQARHPYGDPYRRFPVRMAFSHTLPAQPASPTQANPVLATPIRCLRSVPVLSEEELSKSKGNNSTPLLP